MAGNARKRPAEEMTDHQAVDRERNSPTSSMALHDCVGGSVLIDGDAERGEGDRCRARKEPAKLLVAEHHEHGECRYHDDKEADAPCPIPDRTLFWIRSDDECEKSRSISTLSYATVLW